MAQTFNTMVIPAGDFKDFLVSFNKIQGNQIQIDTSLKIDMHPHVAKTSMTSPKGIHTVIFPVYSIGDESGGKDTWIIATPKRITNDNKNVVRAAFLKVLKQMQAKGMAMKNKSMQVMPQGQYKFVGMQPDGSFIDSEKAGYPGDDIVDYEQVVQRKPFPSDFETGAVISVEGKRGEGNYLLHLKTSTNPPKSGGRARTTSIKGKEPQPKAKTEKKPKPKTEKKPKPQPMEPQPSTSSLEEELMTISHFDAKKSINKSTPTRAEIKARIKTKIERSLALNPHAQKELVIKPILDSLKDWKLRVELENEYGL